MLEIPITYSSDTILLFSSMVDIYELRYMFIGVSNTKLIKTDTTFDFSHKAKKRYILLN